MSQLTKNTTDLDALITKANALPDAGSSEDLTAVLDAQETPISELEAELEGKAAGGGGGSVETCTVSIQTRIVATIAATIYENGTLSVAYFDNTSPVMQDIENVVCGSMLVIGIGGSWVISADGAELIGKSSSFYGMNIFKITAQASGTAVFNAVYD